MKTKLYHLLLILFSLIGFLEWGDHQQFIFQLEGELLSKFIEDPMSVLHPFTILPLLGQVFLLFTLFQKVPNKKVTFLAIGCISLLFIMILLVGILGLRLNVVLSSLPFLITAVLAVKHHRKT